METTKNKQLSRGIRNNNPFNIRRSKSCWKGLVPSNDKEFCTFSTVTYGLRAGLVLLRNYVRKGFNTPRKIVHRYAPPVENDIDAYLAFIAMYRYPGYLDTKIVTLPQLVGLAKDIAFFESHFLVSYDELMSICKTFKIRL